MGGGMPDFNGDLAGTKDHPNLINFLDVCNAACGEQTVQFFKFLKQSVFGVLVIQSDITLGRKKK